MFSTHQALPDTCVGLGGEPSGSKGQAPREASPAGSDKEASELSGLQVKKRNLTGISEARGDLHSKGDAGGGREKLQPSLQSLKTHRFQGLLSGLLGHCFWNLPFRAHLPTTPSFTSDILAGLLRGIIAIMLLGNSF